MKKSRYAARMCMHAGCDVGGRTATTRDVAICSDVWPGDPGGSRDAVSVGSFGLASLGGIG